MKIDTKGSVAMTNNCRLRRITFARAVMLACSFTWALGPAFAVVEPDRVRQSETRQQQIKQQTERATTELTSIITEFDRNGLGDGADVQVLKAIRTVLANLTDKDIAAVSEYLAGLR